METKRKIAIAFIALLFVGATLSLIFFTDTSSNNQDFLSISSGAEGEILDFCINEQQCVDFFVDKGMPDDFLELNGVEIICENEICKIFK